MKLFWEMQDRRKAEERELALVARQPKPLTRTASASSSENGFVFSVDQTPAPTAQTDPVEATLTGNDTGQKAA